MTPAPIPDPDIEAATRTWETLQNNGAVAYDADPQANLSVGPRREARQFAEFSELSGTILDVGCGPQAVPSYGLDVDGRLVGIDPLTGVQPRQFDFVKGIGEYLPFRDETFDRVLFATSLDHVLDPLKALREARRVVRPTGLIGIWFAEHHHSHDEEKTLGTRAATVRLMLRRGQYRALAKRTLVALGASKQSLRPAYMSDLEVPPGAVDHFHAYNLTRHMVDDWMGAADMTTVRAHEDEDVGSFLLVRPTGSRPNDEAGPTVRR
jgi:ubiquinone/menaquinone biosynthesis C-methylase UbiE